MTDSRVLTVAQCALELGQSQHFVRSLIADEQVHAHKHRGRWYITRVSVADWLAAGSPAPHAPEPLTVVPAYVRPKGRRAS